MLVSERENTIFMEPKNNNNKKIEIKFLNGKLLVASYVKRFQLKYVKICRFFFSCFSQERMSGKFLLNSFLYPADFCNPCYFSSTLNIELEKAYKPLPHSFFCIE